MDSGASIILIIVLAGMILGSAMSVSQWLLSHIRLVIVLLFLKAIFFLGFKAKGRKLGLKIKILHFITIIIDMSKSYIVLLAVIDGVLKAFGDGLFNMFVTGIGLFIGVPILIIASSGPLSIVIDEDTKSLFIGEVLSLIAVVICCFVIYGIFDGW